MREHALALKKGESGRFSALDELPGDWWSLAENEPGGYQYRTVVQVLGRRVECMLDGCAGANHVTEELLIGMLNRASWKGRRRKRLGQVPRFSCVARSLPVVQRLARINPRRQGP